MKILLSCQFFNYCSGSAMYVHDLAVELKKRGHDVTILSDLGGEIANSAIKNQIRVVDFSQIFTIQDEKFDVLHLQQKGPSEMALEFFDAPAVFTIHSELNIETAYKHPNIKKYIAIRPTIVEKYKDLNPELIYNGIDFERFNKKNMEEIKAKKKQVGINKSIVLFVGTTDVLRAHTIKDLMDSTAEHKDEFWVVGRNMLPYPLPADKVKILPETFFVEKWIEMSDLCAGILVGRTALEAWACGKSYLCYDVNDSGQIISKKLMTPPDDMSQHDIKFMTDKVEEIYKNIIDKKPMSEEENVEKTEGVVDETATVSEDAVVAEGEQAGAELTPSEAGVVSGTETEGTE